MKSRKNSVVLDHLLRIEWEKFVEFGFILSISLAKLHGGYCHLPYIGIVPQDYIIIQKNQLVVIASKRLKRNYS